MAELKIIAEVAQGYEGKPELASLLVTAASKAKADGIKFQLVYAEELATPDYQHYKLFQSLEMPDSAWEATRLLAERLKLELYLDVFGTRSLRLAEKLLCSGIKVHSTDMGNFGLLQAVAASSVPLVILSIAGCSDAEISEALGLMQKKNVVLLHGFQGYPTPTEANHIARMRRLTDVLREKKLGATRASLGFADHAAPDDPLRFVLPAVAVGAGAVLLEKHLTLSKVMEYEDHESALNPDEFAEFTALMRASCDALGSSTALHAAELDYRQKTRKHVVAARNIAAGEEIKPDMVGLLRTASATAIYDARSVYGKRAKSAISAGSAITASALEK